MKLRLLITDRCNQKCKWCQNKHWDLSALPRETSFGQYDEVMLTGGEPLLVPELLISTAKNIRKTSNAKIYLYTAKIDDWKTVLAVLHFVDGMSVTPHSQTDVLYFKILNEILRDSRLGKSLKLNLFTDYEFVIEDNLDLWRVKQKKWFKVKHIPKNEVFKRV